MFRSIFNANQTSYDFVIDNANRMAENIVKQIEIDNMRREIESLKFQIMQAQIDNLQSQIDDLKQNCDIVDVVPIEIDGYETSMVKR